MTYGDLLLPHAIMRLMVCNGLYFLSLKNMLENTRYPGLKQKHLETVIYKAQADGFVEYIAETHCWHATPKGWAQVQSVMNHLMFEACRA